MRIVVKYRGAVILCLALAACGASPPRPTGRNGVPATPSGAAGTPAGQAAPPPGGPAPSAGQAVPRPGGPGSPPGESGHRYRIDPEHSELRVLVYRAGPMASLGHNHVISTHALEGWATFEGDPSAAAFAVTAPVADFVIDDPALRKEEGADFAEGVADEARSGTAHNMLGPAVLNAADFPALSIRSVSVTAAAESLRARVALEVAGHASTLDVPFRLETSPRRLVARGELTVSQSSLGLTPFSVFLGALRVQDELRVKFTFTAVGDGA